MRQLVIFYITEISKGKILYNRDLQGKNSRNEKAVFNDLLKISDRVPTFGIYEQSANRGKMEEPNTIWIARCEIGA